MAGAGSCRQGEAGSDCMRSEAAMSGWLSCLHGRRQSNFWLHDQNVPYIVPCCTHLTISMK